ncbi:MAG: DNA repair protein RadA [Gammaproteobacteria bacterium]
MPKPSIAYRCEACGAEAPRWIGRCPDCGAWNTLTEVARLSRTHSGRTGADAHPRTQSAELININEVEGDREERHATGLGELDRVLGGGFVPGSVVLVGGDPGIGKSTLLLQAGAFLARNEPVIYVSGEESPLQVASRSRRLGLDCHHLSLIAETHLETIIPLIQKAHPRMVVIDSIQTVYSDRVESAPGSVTQLRESTAALVRLAKTTGAALFIIGHVTKEGAIAGPRVLEHLVDTVLYFENDLGSRYRIVRSVKNRYGAANEAGIFLMTENGLREIRNPSAIFLSSRLEGVSGSAVTVTREGSRPMLVEVQALVDDAQSMPPRRITVGTDPPRLSLLLAIFNRHSGQSVAGRDVFVNVVGGLRISETAVDLPVLLAVWSNLLDRPLPQDLVAFGEVGLSGEIRPVFGGEERLRESMKHGFKKALVPRGNVARQGLEGAGDLCVVSRLDECLKAIENWLTG